MQSRSTLIILSTVFLITVLWSCGTGDKSSESSVLSAPADAAGRTLVSSQCATCHSLDPAGPNVTAPSMAEVKRNYLETDMSLEKFKAGLMTFLLSPSPQNARMHDAVEKYGLMPPMGYSKQQIEDAAEYLYAADLETADNSMKSSEEVQLSLQEQGMNYALATKAILGKNLMGQIKKNGTESALTFCNEKAIHLTDSMAMAQDVHIKRVSDKPRNPENRANEAEALYIRAQKERLAAGQAAQPQMIERNGVALGYYPILTNAMCLQCHGTVDDTVQPEVLERIVSLYPSDEATGYAADELRGIWVVEMLE